MRRIATISLFAANMALMFWSWHLWKSPHADEYLVIFMIALIFIMAPFYVDLEVVGILLSLNLAWLVFLLSLGLFSPIDVFTLMVLFSGCAGLSFFVRNTHEAVVQGYARTVATYRKRYNSQVNDLENVDRRGKKIEDELARVSRLYEITTKLAPALTFGELMDNLFEFLEENIPFSKVHLLIFHDDEFTDAISRTVGQFSAGEEAEDELDHGEVVTYTRSNGKNASFLEIEKHPELLLRLNVNSDTYMQFPLYLGDRLCAVLAVEGASRHSYGRLSILIPHIVLEIRKIELYEKVQQLSITDGLTQVYLRRYLMKRLAEEIDRSRRLGLTFSLGMVDVDYFKECNDRYGHLVGDVVLSKIAERLKGSVREVDLIARYGGEEFCIVLPETNKELSLVVCERLRKAIASREINAYGENVGVSVSVGIATFPGDAQDLRGLIEKADMALYKAKRSGRNRVCTA